MYVGSRQELPSDLSIWNGSTVPLAANLGCPCLAEFHDIHRHPAWQGAILGATAATPHENISINQIDNEGFGFPLPLHFTLHPHSPTSAKILNYRSRFAHAGHWRSRLSSRSEVN